MSIFGCCPAGILKVQMSLLSCQHSKSPGVRAHSLGSRCAHCAPNPVLTQCTVYSHCLEHCSWTLFMSNVHKVKKKEYKNFKNFLVYDLINGIFILHYLWMH